MEEGVVEETRGNRMERGNPLRGKIVDKDSGALPQRQHGVALDLDVGGQHALCQPRDDGLGEVELLLVKCVSYCSPFSHVPLSLGMGGRGSNTSMEMVSRSLSLLSEGEPVGLGRMELPSASVSARTVASLFRGMLALCEGCGLVPGPACV